MFVAGLHWYDSERNLLLQLANAVRVVVSVQSSYSRHSLNITSLVNH